MELYSSLVCFDLYFCFLLILVITMWRAHVEIINSLDFIDEHKLLITASNDCSVRLWNKDGDYIGKRNLH